MIYSDQQTNTKHLPDIVPVWEIRPLYGLGSTALHHFYRLYGNVFHGTQFHSITAPTPVKTNRATWGDLLCLNHSGGVKAASGECQM
ncbi:hypothetical protein [Acinetobacter sp. A47]|uniref:hypothetical protein n=1 Tax=Acinetobacter sp. A47 TaxID=1561217 RepID=UPI001269A2B9|nr:hypothetical protein [Acinetobacter sp. A47]